MKRNLTFLGILLLLCASCGKKNDGIEREGLPTKDTATQIAPQYIKYTIFEGHQYCDKSAYEKIKCSEFSFMVKFDSSAIYKTVKESNQNDINKLMGFSDHNATHHEYSARFGWRWSDHALRLFAYIYNNSVMSYKEIGVVKPGVENNCSIKVFPGKYVFTLNGIIIIMPREDTSSVAEGYQLWPYFGGDELAPHTISIWIKKST